jgi:hypothetical protein
VHAVSVVLAVVLVLGIGPVVNYPLLGIAGRLFDHDVSPAHRLVNIWGGIHAVVSVALVLRYRGRRARETARAGGLAAVTDPGARHR